MTDKLMEDLDVGASGIANLGGAYYFAYASLQLVSVMFVDWFGVVESLVRWLFANAGVQQFTGWGMADGHGIAVRFWICGFWTRH